MKHELEHIILSGHGWFLLIVVLVHGSPHLPCAFTLKQKKRLLHIIDGKLLLTRHQIGVPRSIVLGAPLLLRLSSRYRLGG